MMDFDYDAIIESAQEAIDTTLDNANKEDADNEIDVSTDVEDTALDAIVGGGSEGIFISEKDIDDIDAGVAPKEYDPIDVDARAAEQDEQIKELSKDIENNSVITKEDIKDIKEGASIYDVTANVFDGDNKEEFFNLDNPAKPAFSSAIQQDNVECHCSQCGSDVAADINPAQDDTPENDDIEEIVTVDDFDGEIDPLEGPTQQDCGTANTGEDKMSCDITVNPAQPEEDHSNDIEDAVQNEPPGPVIPLSDHNDDVIEGDVYTMFDDDLNSELECAEFGFDEAASNDPKTFLNDDQIENLTGVKIDSIGIENDYEGSGINTKQKAQNFLLGMDSNVDEDSLKDPNLTDTYGGNSEYTTTKKSFFDLEDDSIKCMQKKD